MQCTVCRCHITNIVCSQCPICWLPLCAVVPLQIRELVPGSDQVLFVAWLYQWLYVCTMGWACLTARYCTCENQRGCAVMLVTHLSLWSIHLTTQFLCGKMEAAGAEICRWKNSILGLKHLSFSIQSSLHKSASQRIFVLWAIRHCRRCQKSFKGDF